MNEWVNSNLVRYGDDLWSRCRLRKSVKCAMTGEILAAGEDAFRPVSNGYGRMKRIGARAMARFFDKSE